MTEHVKIKRNANTSVEYYHPRECANLQSARNTEQITKAKAERLGLECCSRCDGIEQPDSHDTRHIDALRAAGGD